jgi:predicted TIM-barrel fold metal-dependent hydrolase
LGRWSGTINRVNRFTRLGSTQTRVDLHQHLWPEAFISALAGRDRPPRIVTRDGGPWLDLAFEPGGAFSAALHAPERRLAVLDAGGIDTAVISISTPIGVEALPEGEARPLLDAYHDGIAEVVDGSGGRLRAFAAACLSASDMGAAAVAERLRAGFAGLSLPSEALVTPAGLDRCAPLLRMLERAGRPLFVHPGPAPWTRPDPADQRLPAWWTPLAQYPAWSLRAFATWRALGAAAYPRLRVVFAIMAGGAPFLEGRWRTFSGLAGAIDRNVFLDTASCQRLDLELALAAYGAEQIVLGTDVPVIDPAPLLRSLDALGPFVLEAVAERNPARVLDHQGGIP